LFAGLILESMCNAAADKPVLHSYLLAIGKCLFCKDKTG